MKTSKNNAEKIHNAALILSPAPDTRKPKKPRPKTRKNNKQTPPKPQQETKQRKQQQGQLMIRWAILRENVE